MKHIQLTILAAILLTPLATLHAQSGPCSCDDLNNIQNRLRNVENLIRAYTDAFRGTPEGDKWTHSAWAALTDKIDQQTQTLPNPYPHSYTGIAAGHTDFSCNITLPKDVSGCIVESLRLHEEVHQNACRHPHGEPGVLENWQNLLTVREAIFEDIQAYNAERRFLQEQKHKLECSCPYYAIHFNYMGLVDEQRAPVSARQVTATPVPVEIPLTLKDDGTFSGEATAVLQGDGTLRSPYARCQSTDQGLIRLRVSGTITGPENAPQMHLQAASEAPPEHTTAMNCATNAGPYRNVLPGSGNNGSLAFDLPADVGEQRPAKLLEFGKPELGLFVSLTAVSQIAETSEKAQIMAAQVWGNEARPPDVLPVCSAKP